MRLESERREKGRNREGRDEICVDISRTDYETGVEVVKGGRRSVRARDDAVKGQGPRPRITMKGIKEKVQGVIEFRSNVGSKTSPSSCR